MSRRTLLILLAVSLAVNLFAIGAVVGGLAIATHRPRAEAGVGRPGPALWAAAESLPEDQRRAYRRLLREQGRLTGQTLRQAREDRRAAWGRMAQEPFDAKATIAALDHARRLEMNARGGAEHRIVEFAAALPPAERARLAQGLASAAPEHAMAARRRAMAPEPPAPEDRPSEDRP